MADEISRDEFYAKGGKVCVLNTNEGTTDMGLKVDEEARRCPFRQPDTTIFTEHDFKGKIFSTCSHPERNLRYSLFCGPFINRINQEPE